MIRRPRKLAAALLVALGCALAAPLIAVAQQSPFQGLPPAPQQVPETTPTTRNTTTIPTDSGLETWQGILIVLGGVALLGGIGLAIARDARQRAPVDAYGDEQVRHDADAHQHARAAKQRQRQKAKAARAARRRNR